MKNGKATNGKAAVAANGNGKKKGSSDDSDSSEEEVKKPQVRTAFFLNHKKNISENFNLLG